MGEKVLGTMLVCEWYNTVGRGSEAPAAASYDARGRREMWAVIGHPIGIRYTRSGLHIMRVQWS